MLEELKNDTEKVDALKNIIVSRATGGTDNDEQAYKTLRAYFIQSSAA